jgi:hypothetical protein
LRGAALASAASLFLTGCEGGIWQVACYTIERSNNAPIADKVNCYLAEVAWLVARMPVISEVMKPVLNRVPGEQHWMIGALIVLLVLGALGGWAQAGSSRQK